VDAASRACVKTRLDPLDLLSPKRQNDTGEDSDIIKYGEFWEDPRATGGLVSNLPHPRVNKTKQHTPKVGLARAVKENETEEGFGCTIPLHYGTTTLVCIPDVIGALAVWRQNIRIKKKNQEIDRVL